MVGSTSFSLLHQDKTQGEEEDALGGAGRAAVGCRYHQRHLALEDFQPASKMCASIHKPLCELSSAGFRQPYNVLQGMSWRAAKAIIKGNIIIPVPGMEKARKVSQKRAVALEQNHKSRQSMKSRQSGYLTLPLSPSLLQREHCKSSAGAWPWGWQVPRAEDAQSHSRAFMLGQIIWGQALLCQPGWRQLYEQDTKEKYHASPY